MVDHSIFVRRVRGLGTALRSRWAGVARGVAAAFGALALAVVGLGVLATPAWAAGPTISVSPSSAAAGSRVTVSGTGWSTNDSVTIYLGTGTLTELCHVTASSTGTIATQSCTVPTILPDAAYTISAKDAGSLTETGGSLTIVPSVTLLGEGGNATATAAPGQSVGITGAGFSASSTLSAKFGASAVTLSPGAVSTATGSISGVSFKVPSSAPTGVATVTVTDANTHSATYDLDIYHATISHTPANADSGQPVTFSGSGWPENDSISVRLVQGSNPPIGVCSVTADSTGTVSPESCLVPAGVVRGTYTVVAVDGSISVEDTSSFVLQSGIVLLGEAGRATSDATPGQQIQVTGSGFAPTSNISATFGGVTVSLTGTTLQTNSSGSFSGVSFKVPSSAGVGTQPVVVRDAAGNNATFALFVYQATISTNINKGDSGRQILFTGTGWPGLDTLTISMVSSSGAATNACSAVTVTTNSDGVLDAHSCIIPTTIPRGSYTVTAVDGSLSESAVAKFSLEPGVALLGEANSTTANADQYQTLGIVATGFAPSTDLTVEFNGAAVPTTPATLETSPAGAAPTSTFVVPGVSSPKTVTVTVLETTSPAIVAKFTLHVFKATLTPAATTGVSGHHMAFTGGGWPGNDPISVRLVSGSNATMVCRITTDATGTIEKQTCPMPTSIPQGPYTLNAEDTFINYNYGLSAGTVSPFTLNPGIAMVLVNNQGATTNVIHRAAVGQVVGVSGTGFASDSIVTAKFGTTPVVLTTSSVSISGALPVGTTITPEFTVQPASPGLVTITITDGDNNTASFSLYVYQATISHSPTNAASGHRMTLTGSGWPGEETIVVSLTLSTAPGTTVCTISADSTGAIAGQTCSVPSNLPANQYKLNASDGQIYINDTTDFDMAPGLTLFGATAHTETTTAAPGQSIGVAGTGYAPATGLTAMFGSTPIKLSPAPTIVTDGSFSGTAFTVPAATTPGQYVVTVTDADNDAATYDLNVYDTSIATSSSSGVAGQPLGFSGSGWPANDPVTVRLEAGSNATSVCTIDTDSTGSLNLESCNLPTTLLSGSYAVNASDGSISVNDNTSLTIT